MTCTCFTILTARTKSYNLYTSRSNDYVLIEFWVKMTCTFLRLRWHCIFLWYTLKFAMMTLHILTFAMMTLHIFTVLTFQTRIWPLVSAEARVSLSATCLKVGDRFHRICNTDARCSSRHWKQIKIILLFKFLCSFRSTHQNRISFTIAIPERINFSTQTRAC